jgi:hypothetical protein
MNIEENERDRVMLLSVQTMILVDHIDRNGDGVVNCATFERIIRDGFAKIAERDDLGDLAVIGRRLLAVESAEAESSFVEWMDVSDFFESACRMFSVFAAFKARQDGIDDDDIAGYAAFIARSFVHFCDTYPCTSPETPDEFRRAAMVNYRDVCDELPKLNINVRNIEVAPAPRWLQ